MVCDALFRSLMIHSVPSTQTSSSLRPHSRSPCHIVLFAPPGYYLAGCGVRLKYGFVKVYAVGTYFDPLAMSAVQNSTPDAIQDALLNPTYPRTIRIVMARGLSIQKYMDAIVEAIEPRMMGKDLDK
jgi:hypothetical protein